MVSRFYAKLGPGGPGILRDRPAHISKEVTTRDFILQRAEDLGKTGLQKAVRVALGLVYKGYGLYISEPPQISERSTPSALRFTTELHV